MGKKGRGKEIKLKNVGVGKEIKLVATLYTSAFELSCFRNLLSVSYFRNLLLCGEAWKVDRGRIDELRPFIIEREIFPGSS